MEAFLTAENAIALATLAGLEIVLGIDNIVFIAILTQKLPPANQMLARRIGLLAAMFMRIGLLLVIGWVMGLTAILFSVFEQPFSGRDLILLGGGLVEALPGIYADEVQRAAEAQAMPSFRGTFRVCVANLGDFAAVKGAAAWAHRIITRDIEPAA